MARINREILVPYLQDICALELAKKQRQDRIGSLNTALSEAKYAVQNQTAPETVHSNYQGYFLSQISRFGIVWFEWGLFVAFLVAILEQLGMSSPGDGVVTILWIVIIGVAVGPILAIGAFLLRLILKGVTHIGAFGGTLQNRHQWRKQKRELKRNERSCEDSATTEIQGLNREIGDIQNLLDQAYAANLIPSRYRDLYAAVYLYDWFSTSMADDMDMALNTYVLEQIKSRLDTIIQNQTQQIINQRRIMAQQAAMNRTIEREAERMRDSVAQMNESLEKQNMYLSMIDSNVAATRYFAEETYKKWY